MRRCFATVSMVLATAGCGVPGEAISTGQTTTTATSAVSAPAAIEQDTVHELMVGAPEAPVKVLFGHHAAIYLLDRNDPNFAAWLAVLQQAHDQGTQVRFAYDVYGPRLTLVESAQ